MGSQPIKEKKDKQGEIIYLLISEFLISLKNYKKVHIRRTE